MRLLLIFLTLALSACATYVPGSIDPRAMPLVAEFQERTGIQDVSTIMVRFASLPYPKLGTCTRGPSAEGYVRIITLEKSLEGSGLRTVWWHEVGHCIFGLDHSDDPDDIMYPKSLPKHWANVDALVDRMLMEVFSRRLLKYEDPSK